MSISVDSNISSLKFQTGFSENGKNTKVTDSFRAQQNIVNLTKDKPSVQDDGVLNEINSALSELTTMAEKSAEVTSNNEVKHVTNSGSISREDLDNAIKEVDAAIKAFASANENMSDTTQSRLNEAVNNLLTAKESFNGVEDQIRTNNVATEAAKTTSNNILENKDTAVKAQANQPQELALSLIG